MGKWHERVHKQCATCSEEMVIKPSDPRLYCSWECKVQGQRVGRAECATCGGTVTRPDGKYCSFSCTGESKRRPKKPLMVRVQVDLFGVPNAASQWTRYRRRKCLQCKAVLVHSRRRSTKCAVCVEENRKAGIRKGKPAARSRRRARESGANVVETGIFWRSVAHRDGMECSGCGIECTPPLPERAARQPVTNATLDHVVPLADGGDHSWENVQILCLMCNSLKAVGTMVDLRLKLSERRAPPLTPLHSLATALPTSGAPLDFYERG